MATPFLFSVLLLPPISLPLPSQFMVLSKPVQISVVDEEVSSLLAKHAIRLVSRMSLGLVSRMFVVPKKDGGWRPIVKVAQQDVSRRSPLPDGPSSS